MDNAASRHCLELERNPVRFNPISSVTNVFFDDLNKQVFAVENVNETSVTVKGPTEKSYTFFHIINKGPLISIKFSKHHKILAVQRNEKSVEFSNFVDGATDPIEYSQTCKGKNNKIKIFHWISATEIVFVTQEGIEFYQANTEKRFLKCIKNQALTVNWSVFSPESSVLLVSTSDTANVLVPFYFNNGQMVKLQKFEVESPKPNSTSSGPKPVLQERDVILLRLYNTLYAAVLKHPVPNTGEKCVLHLFLLNKDANVRKAFILRLGMIGRFAFNTVDNLVIAHHQVSKTSMLFDIKMPGVSKRNVIHLDPIVSALPIKPFALRRHQGSDPESRSVSKVTECELYSLTWIVFRPNIIIDAALGCMWYLKLVLQDFVEMLSDQCALLDFLLLRASSKQSILYVCQEALSLTHRLPLSQISTLFSKINQMYRDYIDAEEAYVAKAESQSDTPVVPHHRDWVVVDQADLFAQVLDPFVQRDENEYQFKIAVLLEYIKSLGSFKIEVQPFLYESLVSTLVRGRFYFKLQQLILHHVIEDSKSVANLLLSLESAHEPCYQLALDMFMRLASADDQVIDVLLSKKEVIVALRFVRHVGMMDLIPARKFLAAAMHDDMTFYNVYKFFEARNVRLNGKPEFTAAEKCDEFMLHYVSRFACDVIADDS